MKLVPFCSPRWSFVSTPVRYCMQHAVLICILVEHLGKVVVGCLETAILGRSHNLVFGSPNIVVRAVRSSHMCWILRVCWMFACIMVSNWRCMC